MVLKAFLLTVTFTALASAATKEEDFHIHNHSDDYDDYEYDDEVRSIQTDRPTSVQTEKPAVRYEVTENVDDIPNNITYAGPVVANHTIKPPINIVTVAKNTSINSNNNANKDIDDFDNFYNGYIDGFNNNDKHTVNKVNKNLRKNSISIFHVNAEFDDDKPTVQNININKLPNIDIFNFKDHVDRFKDGVVNHIYNVHNKEVHNEVNHGFVVPNIVAGPIAFLSKLHKKGSAVASKLHNVIFGHFGDY